jgi:hypothetical protein
MSGMAHFRKLTTIVFVLVCYALNPLSVKAANLTLVTDAPANSPLVITPLDANERLVVSVVNDTAVDPAAEFMTSWQFWLRAIPDAGASGTLNPVNGIVPDNYVFEDTPRFGPIIASLPEDPTTLNALDLLLPPNPPAVQIPTAPGKNLISMAFQASPDALGRFGIFAVDRHTLWVDNSNSGGFRSFVNVPIDDGLTRIGDVLVTSAADYNRNGIVDAADYTVWRDAFGSTANLAADGNANGMIDDGDYGVWESQFGMTVPGFGAGSGAFAGAAVPEPATWLPLLVGTLIAAKAARSLASKTVAVTTKRVF